MRVIFDLGPPESYDIRERWMYQLLASAKPLSVASRKAYRREVDSKSSALVAGNADGESSSASDAASGDHRRLTGLPEAQSSSAMHQRLCGVLLSLIITDNERIAGGAMSVLRELLASDSANDFPLHFNGSGHPLKHHPVRTVTILISK